jgi:hypothetical protein
MSVKACGCVYATAHNTKAVADGFEMGGYLKLPCARHGGKKQPATPEDVAELVAAATEVYRISERSHDAWLRLQRALAAFPQEGVS